MSPSSLLIAQITDIHLFDQASGKLLGLQTSESFRAVLEQIRDLERQPDLLMLTGDVSQNGTSESYIILRDLLRPLGIPTCWLPGNHDNPEAMQKLLSQSPFIPEKSLHLGDWQLILLDSSQPECVHGYLSPSQLDWLVQELRRSPNTPTLIAVHHPPFKIGSRWMDEIGLKNAEELLDICDRHPQIQLALFGHIHQEFRQDWNGVAYLGTPSTCIQFKPNTPNFTLDELAPGFRLVTLNADGTWATQIKHIEYSCELDLAAAGY
jgi:3',5'-cyclic-AMP phosphodiesterase